MMGATSFSIIISIIIGNFFINPLFCDNLRIKIYNSLYLDILFSIIGITIIWAFIIGAKRISNEHDEVALAIMKEGINKNYTLIIELFRDYFDI